MNFSCFSDNYINLIIEISGQMKSIVGKIYKKSKQCKNERDYIKLMGDCANYSKSYMAIQVNGAMFFLLSI